MAIQQKPVTIQGTEFLISHLPTTRGITVMKQLVKVAGPAMAKFDSSGEEGTAIAGVIGAVLDNLDQVDVENLIKQIVSSATLKNGMAIQFETEFAGAYDKLYLLLKEVVEFNFGSVFTLFGSGE
ncbi:tail assembly chaperone [Pseudomonas phage vB_PseuGesM_254]|uniref:Tail assembly chaperone n=1 Tax=Pseudomonas phage vB_PseuGesM_254 TaxID=3092638 RepID=A0AAX4G6H5_9CAUD|nr:tail assembly chaperone [Pseudomonas phage PseuGes_254]